MNLPNKKTLFVEKGNRVYFPENYLVFFPEAESEIVNDEKFFFVVSTKEELLKRKISFTHAENWYYDLELANEGEKYLTFPSILIPFEESPKEKEKEIQKAIVSLGKKCFIRLNSVSPKWNFPVFSSGEVIKILLETERTRDAMKEYDNYVMLRKYEEFPKEKEFRCFINKGKLRAISRYDVYDFSQINGENIQKLVKRWFSRLCFENLVLFDECTMDIVVWEENKEKSLFGDGIFIVEYNSFGYDSVSGSCLFHWEKDWEILTKGDAVIRV